MTDYSSSDRSEIDDDNNLPVPNGMPEGMLPGGVNDSWRGDAGATARFWNRINPKYTTTGASGLYVVTPDATLAAWANSEVYWQIAHQDSDGGDTLQWSALSAINIQKMTASGLANIAAGDIKNGQPFGVMYNGTVGVIVSPLIGSGASGTVTSVATGVGLTGGPITDTGTIDFDINNITAETVPAIDDVLAMFDITASGHRKLRLDNMLKVIDGLTLDATPDAGADFLVSYDASANAAKKIAIDSLPSGNELGPGYMSGMITANNGSDTAHDIDVSPGSWRDAADLADIVLASAMTKQIDATWTAGTNQGGRSSSVALANNTVYGIFAIIVAGVEDVGFDTSLTGANLVTDHSATSVRRIGFIRTDGSANIRPYTEVRKGEVILADSINDVSATATTTGVLGTLSVPTGLRVKAIIDASADPAGGGALLISSPDQTDVLPALPGGPFNMALTSGDRDGGRYEIWTNTSGQVRYRASASVSNFSMWTVGWIDDLAV